MNKKIFQILFLLPILGVSYRCVNFYGLETPEKKLVCSWVQNPAFYLDEMKRLIGIDSIRLPFSYEYGSCSNFEAMDSLIDSCQEKNINVILDYHRGYADHQGMSPIEKNITKEMWIDMLITVLDRYEEKSSVKAISLFNEFQINSTQEAEELQRDAITAIEDIFPGRFEYMVGCIDWGKDCSQMWNTLPNNRTFVEVHSYGFHGGTGKLPTHTNKIFIGELGWNKNETSEFESIKKELRRKKVKNICLWTLAHSKDTGNLYQDDCKTPNDFIVNGFNSLFESYQPKCLRGSN